MAREYMTISTKYGYLVINQPDDGSDHGLFESYEDANEHIEELKAKEAEDGYE